MSNRRRSNISIPILEALHRYVEMETVRFHMPGHKGGLGSPQSMISLFGSNVFALDVTNVPGMDDLHQANGIIRSAQDMAAQLYGADATYFLVNGTSCGLHALVLTVCNPGEKILVPRNIHRSILGGIILAHGIPVFFQPEYDKNLGVPLGVSVDNLREELNRHPEVKAAIVVSPTYHGITSDIAAIAELVHAYDIPLLVDEAHGPHLGFHKGYPASALQGGADACVQGTHKILSAFTQASMLHVKGSRVDQDRLQKMLRLLQSTSTSYLLLASLDAARAQMAAHGRERLQEALEMADRLRQSINNIPGLSCFGKEIIGQKSVKDLDRTKLTISLEGLKITGLWAENQLRDNYRIQVEMSDFFNLLLIITFGNKQEHVDYFLESLNKLMRTAKKMSDLDWDLLKAVNPILPIPEMAFTPTEALLAPSKPVSLEESVGCVSAEIITCYPPGIPVLCPGERIDEDILSYLFMARHLGVPFQGPSDKCLNTIRILR
ncbi:MAG: aminotransferase class I/II-fold pyridoxal phosphate-dependent enzyme [Bacillota bacterium]